MKGDQVLVTNMAKLKRLPNTKEQGKYLGPHKVSRVTESHAVLVSTDPSKKEKKAPLHIVRPYFERPFKPLERKRKAVDIVSNECSKKTKTDSSQVRSSHRFCYLKCSSNTNLGIFF